MSFNLNASTVDLYKTYTEAFSVGINSDGDTGVINTAIMADYFIVTVQTNLAVAIRVDRSDGDYLPLMAGTYKIDIPVKNSIDYRIDSAAAFAWGVTLIRDGRGRL